MTSTRLLFVLVALYCCEAFGQSRPNIIYIMADDLGYADLSCYGNRKYKTPNLDRLASSGVKFTNAYSAGAVCTPTRTAFMTGRFPARTPVGLFEPLRSVSFDSTFGLSPEHPSIATLLKQGGYKTFLLGKWHLGFQQSFHPLKNGFDEYFGFNSGGIDYVSHSNIWGIPDLFENEKRVEKDGYMTDLIRDKAVEIITRNREKPFFLAVMFNAPHWPWQAPGDSARPKLGRLRWLEEGSPEIFSGMMTSLDDAVGDILRALEKEGMLKSTVVIFTSDNGGERFSDMGVFRGRKGQLWEGGIRVPAFISWYGTIPSHTISDQVAVTMDWTATILSIAQIKPHASFPLDGIDLLPICIGKLKTLPRTLYWRTFQHGKRQAVRDGNWKYLKNGNEEYLFNLASDAGETNDHKTLEKDIFNKLKRKFEEWEKSVLPPIPLPPDTIANN